MRLSGVTTYEYDAFGRGVKITDPRGNIAYNYFDQAGRVTLAIDAEGFATATTYTAFGEIATVKRHYTATSGATVSAAPSGSTNSLDATTTFEYDKLGRSKKVTDAEGGYEEFTLNAFGQRTAVRNKLNGTTNYVYDLRGLVTSETLPINSVLANATVQATSVTNTFTYDSRGNRLTFVEADGLAEERTTTYTYDAADRMTQKAGDAITAYSSATSAGSSVTPTEYFYYDRRGNVIEKVDAAGARTLLWYDKLNRVTHQLSATGALTRNFYDDNGNLTETRAYATLETLPSDATGTAPAGTGSYRTKQYVYDALNRLTEAKILSIKTAVHDTTFAVTTGTLTTAYEYDAMGNVVKTTDANGKVTWAYYDKLGRKTTEIDAGNFRTAWTYNTDGNVLTERRYATAGSTPSSTTSPPSAPSTTGDDRVTNFTYDKLGRRITEVRKDVKVHDGSGAHSTQDVTITYAYNALSEVTRKTESTGNYIDYTYDVGGRMTSEQRSAFTDFNAASVTPTVDYYYNGLGNLSRTRQAGTSGTIAVAERVTTYTYGAGGRLATLTDAESFVRTYRYDAAGRVSRDEYVRVKPDASTATEAVGYDYDLEGRVAQQGIVLYVSSAWTRTGTNIDTVMTHYNAFGEVSERGLNSVYAEKFDYDDAGRLWRTNSGDGTWKYFMYDKVGNQTLMVASDGTNIDNSALDTVLDLWTTTRDNIRTTYVDGVVATITKYDARGQAIEVIEPQRERLVGTRDNLSTTRAYNAFGETITEVNALGYQIDYTYNTMGRLIKVESPTVSVTSESGSTSSVRPTEHKYYDVSGRLVASRDANGNLTKLTLLAGTGYNGSEALVTQTQTADNETIVTAYDIHGNARKITDQLARITTQTFDELGRLTQTSRPGGLVETYEYDGLGQRIKRYNNQLTSSVAELTYYDHQGRLAQHVAMGGDTTTYSYTWSSCIATTGMATFGGWTQVTTYANSKTLTEKTDQFGRNAEKTDLGSHTMSFTYDKAGQAGPTAAMAWEPAELYVSQHRRVSTAYSLMGLCRPTILGAAHLDTIIRQGWQCR